MRGAVFRSLRIAIVAAIAAMMCVISIPPNLNSAPTAGLLVADDITGPTGFNGQNIVAMSNPQLETANVSIAYEPTNIYMPTEVRVSPSKTVGLSGAEQTKAYGQPFKGSEEHPLKISSFNQTSIGIC